MQQSTTDVAQQGISEFSRTGIPRLLGTVAEVLSAASGFPVRHAQPGLAVLKAQWHTVQGVRLSRGAEAPRAGTGP